MTDDADHQRYLRRVVDDLLLAAEIAKQVYEDLPNYAGAPVEMPMGHWRDLKEALTSLGVPAEPPTQPEKED